MISKYIFYTKN